MDIETRQIMSKELEVARASFYRFMGRKALQLHWVESHSEVEKKLLSLLYISPDELQALQEGKVNPSKKMIENFKSTCGRGLSEHELDKYLEPFSYKPASTK